MITIVVVVVIAFVVLVDPMDIDRDTAIIAAADTRTDRGDLTT